MSGKLLELWVGSRDTGISVRPDDKYPAAWRVCRGKLVSDMANLTRAKDAAVSWVNQASGRGIRTGQRVDWRVGGGPKEGRR